MSDLRGCYEVIGFRRINYVRKSDGKSTSGYEVSLSLCETMPDQVGEACESVWLNDTYSSYVPELGQIVRKSYNRYGRVETLNPC